MATPLFPARGMNKEAGCFSKLQLLLYSLFFFFKKKKKSALPSPSCLPVHACGTQVKRAPAAAGRVLLVAREQRLTLRRRCFAPLTDTPKRRAAVRTYLDVLAVTPVSLVERRKKKKTACA